MDYRFWQSWRKYSIVAFLCAVVFSILLNRCIADFILSFFLVPCIYLFVEAVYKKIGNYTDKQFIWILFLIALIIRIIAVFVFVIILNEYIGIPFLSYKDDYNYHETALLIVNRWRESGIGFYSDIFWSTGFYSGYPNFSALLMYIFGDSFYVPRIGNALLSALTCVLAYKICTSFSERKYARLVAVVFALFPLFVEYAALQLKDSLLLFLCFLSVWEIIQILLNKKVVFPVLVCATCFLGMVFIRAAAIIPIIAGFLLVIFLRNKKSFKDVFLFLFIITLLLVAWKYFASIEAIATFDDYYTSRFDSMTGKDFSATDAKLATSGLAKLVGAPLYLLLSPFLPPVLFADLPDAETINYTAFPLLVNLTILPFLICAIVNVLINFRQEKIPFYILLVFVFYKIGQATSLMSILNPRQSLSTMALLYLLLPMYFSRHNMPKLRHWTFIIAIVVSIIYSGVRLYSRGLL